MCHRRWILALALLACARAAGAHPAPYSYVDVRLATMGCRAPWSSTSSTRRTTSASLAPSTCSMPTRRAGCRSAAAELKLPDRFKDYGLQQAQDNFTKIYAELSR